MTLALFVLNIFVLCIISSYSPAPTFESETLCYEHIRAPWFQVAINWNVKFSAPPYYLYLKVETNFLITKSLKRETFFYHLKLTKQTCTDTMKFIFYDPALDSIDVFIDVMTNYDGQIMTSITFFASGVTEIGLVKVPDHYSMLEIYMHSEPYGVNIKANNILPTFPHFPKRFVVDFVNERAPQHEYVCASANNRMVVLKLVSNFNGPTLGYFGSISVVIFRNEQYVHSETWNGWPCPSWNAISPMSPTIVIEGPINNVIVLFRKNKIGEPDRIGDNINYASFAAAHTFSCPSLQVVSLSAITSPLSEHTVIYGVSSESEQAICYPGKRDSYRIFVRTTRRNSIKVQKYLHKMTKVAKLKWVKYEPSEQDSC